MYLDDRTTGLLDAAMPGLDLGGAFGWRLAAMVKQRGANALAFEPGELVLT